MKKRTRAVHCRFLHRVNSVRGVIAMIANLVVGGLAAGRLYAMVGIAIVIVLNITDIANFAQGEMAMLTTFFAYWLMDGVGLPWWQAVLIAIVFGLVQGIVSSRS